MSKQSQIAFITYTLSIIALAVGTAIGPWSWWVNLLVIGTPWALMFPRRNARRQGYSLRSYLATADAEEWLALVPTMAGTAALWPITVPFMWMLVQGGVFGERFDEKDTIAS